MANPANEKTKRPEEPSTPRLFMFVPFLVCCLILNLTHSTSVRAQGVAPRPPDNIIQVTVLYLNDVHQFTPVDQGTRGSLARVSTLVKLIRKESQNTFFVFGGNTISPSAESRVYEGRQMIDAWNTAGLDFAVLGDQDFHFGSRVLVQRIAESRFKWLGANVYEGRNNLPGVLSFEILDVGGMKVGLLGLVGVKSTTNFGGPTFRNVNEVAQEAITRMRGLGAKTFIALTNMSLEEDMELARNVPDINVIVGGRSTFVTKAVGGRTPIFKTSAEARDLGRLDLYIDRLRGELESIDSTVIPVTSEIPEDPQFAALNAKYLKPDGNGTPRCGMSAPTNPSNCAINQQFRLACALPFVGERREVDQRCPNEGCASTESEKAQNRIRNNLCSKGPPVEINFNSIDKLQAAVDGLAAQQQISYGSDGPPQPVDRAKLQGLATVDASGRAITIGEGNLVSLDAFVLNAKHDDTFPFGLKGDSANCKNSLLEWNDISIALGESESTSECSSVSAKIIPHYRPPLWNRFDSNSCSSQQVVNPLPVNGLRVKITGQLFFDGSHKPSGCLGTPVEGNPLRRSVWEIHPVYAIEVFDKNEKRFVSLDQWAKATEFSISERQVGDVTILDVDGNITASEGTVALRSAVRALLERGRKKVLLNLAEVSYIDDSGIGELVTTYNMIAKQGGQFKLLNPTTKVRDLLTITKLLTVFDVYDNEKAAVASFK